MAVNDITHTPPVPLTAPQVRERGVAQPSAVYADTAPAATAQAAAVVTPAQQAAEVINEVLQNLNFVSTSEPGPLGNVTANPLLTAIDAGQGLTPAQQAALVVNETLFGLDATTAAPVDALLINETPPLVEALPEFQNLTIAQQLAGQFNENLQELSNLSPALTTTEVTASTPAPVGETETLTGAPTAAATPQATTLATTTAAEGVVTAAQTTATTAATATTAETALTSTTQTTQNAVSTSPRDPTPFAFAVYEVRDPHPAPGEPKPISKQITPPLPPGRVRPVDRLTLKREWERRGEGEQRQTPAEDLVEDESLPERSIHQVIVQANDDLARSGLPLRLVLASNAEGLVLDIYNCSGQDLCRLEQEVPIDLAELTTLLDNIQHESGIIINIRT